MAPEGNHLRILNPFFQEAQLLAWLKDEGELFVQAVETGAVAGVMGRIDRHTTLEALQAWPLREYLASGGQPMWFRSHVKSLLNKHLKRLNHATLEKLRLPIPGGRHYVMPATVGRRAGIQGLEIPRGHIQVDDRRGTAWVNDEDWLKLQDSPKGEGIAGILGGADNDDALWLHPFTDGDGERKVLAWRSPNQVGEYVVLRPTAASDEPGWETAAAASTGQRAGAAPAYPPGDSAALPPRIDFTTPSYLGLVETAVSTGVEQTYDVGVMDDAIARAVANQGALGMYCNSLMVNKAVYGRLPAHPPAPLEAIIDGAVKTGADLSRVVVWNYANSREILVAGTAVPAILHRRLSIDWADADNRPPLPRLSVDHWLDRLEAGVRAHIEDMTQRRDALVAQARPPRVVLDAAMADPASLQLGAGLNQAYAAALRLGKGAHATALERARAAVVDYLAYVPPQRRGAVLLGALGSVYGRDKGGMDTAVWLTNSQNDGLSTSPAQETIYCLRELGVLDELIMTRKGIVVYPAESPPDLPSASCASSSGIGPA